MDIATDILRFITIGQLLIILGLLIRSGHLLSAKVTSGFLISIIAYLLADWGQLPDSIAHILFVGVSYALPFFFWMFSKALFDDQFEWRAWMLFVLLGVILVNYLIYFQGLYGFIDVSTANMRMLDLLHHSLALLFAILAIIEAVRSREADLIVTRLRFRTVFISLAAFVMVMTILGEVTFPLADEPIGLEFFQKLIMVALTFYFALNRLQFSPGFLGADEMVTSIAQPGEEKLAQAVVEHIENNKTYRTEGLTIPELASQMGVKEYKLRQAINQNLGFRNFNEFLNSYRIDEACNLLADRANRKMTVIEIVYKVGYKSLAPFNRAFKGITGMTPTEWRKEKVP